MKEKDFQVLFGKWVRSPSARAYVGVSGGGAYELKMVKGSGRLAFDAVKEHQVAGLLEAKHGVLYYKLTDLSLGQKPFDCFVLSGGGAWVCVEYWEEGRGSGQGRGFYMIDIDDWVEERERALRSGGKGSKSFSEARAGEIGIYIKF